eukprot:CAMPEP_0117552258 /NCGR_PEP_ID=MMETSP0784-20121206/49613_1 /TAXON_ID=39447 /ORGANISM="" /LENGTH=155 /DNA_ID=CAMNT_0005349321 /DNA_START=39 /DNA_END=506 /DNA_ORIENTATION=-
MSEADSQDIFYVCKKAMDTIQEKLKKGEEIKRDTVEELTFPENLADEEIMVPVDMRGVGTDFEDVEQMMEKLGPKGTAEAFVKALEYFAANKDNEPEDERPQPMTAKDWRDVLSNGQEDGEEELMFEGEEDDFCEESEEEEEGEGEPVPKKAKTD